MFNYEEKNIMDQIVNKCPLLSKTKGKILNNVILKDEIYKSEIFFLMNYYDENSECIENIKNKLKNNEIVEDWAILFKENFFNILKKITN
jgi:hypothetical protein